MLITIITINYNNLSGLKKTLRSVNEQQNFKNFQHLIIDGNSTDGSKEFSQEFVIRNSRSSLVSEDDTGIYNAMNKGIVKAEGDYIAFLNSGDAFSHSKCLSQISNALCRDKFIDVFYGNLVLLDSNSNIIRKWKSGEFAAWKLYYGWMAPHPMTLVRSEILRKIGGFNENFQISADYDLLLRIFLHKPLKVRYFHETFVEMEAGGVSNGSVSAVIRGNSEVLRSWLGINGIFTPYWIFLTKPLIKILQFLKL